MKSYIVPKALILLLLFVGHLPLTKAQDFLPVLNDNYMGINQAALQPAAIAGSRFKVDVNLMGFNNDIYNDLVRIKLSEIFTYEGGAWYKNIDYVDNPNGKDKNAYLSQSLAGPGFLINLGKEHAIGFTTRVRNIMNVDDISEPLARSFVTQFKQDEYWNRWYADDQYRLVQHFFADYSFHYAREIFDKKQHYMKTGITVKIIQGFSAAASQSEDFYYYMYNDDMSSPEADYISLNSGRTFAGLSDNWNWGSNPNDAFHSGFTFQFAGIPTVGLDLGVVYEFRPEFQDYRYNMDGVKDLVRQDKNQYLLKIGLSVLDIGRVKYKKYYNSSDFEAFYTPDYLTRYNAQDNSVPTNTDWMEIEIMDFGFPPFVNFMDTVYHREQSGRGVNFLPDNEDRFTITLPTALSLQADVNLGKGFFVNLTTYTGLTQSFAQPGRSHYLSNYSITPRYEHKWVGVMLPVYYNQYEKINVGLGLRVAFLYIGVNNLFTAMFDNAYGTNFYFGAKIPIWQPKPPADMDADEVSDEIDQCPSAKGTWELRGCPDRDGDGVTDTEDACPDHPGPKVYNGCPDRDGDGVIDRDDLCPDEAGPALTNGCPDRDGDGVLDSRDECPDVFGLLAFNGCPDKDSDGVPDHLDKCPEVPGPVEQGGCPFMDTDKDGLKDTEDDCPELAGPPENRGCPYSDTDGDGVIDKDDQCPLTPGDIANNGCPVIKAEEAAVLKTAFENLEFETGKAVIRSSSFTSLDELATLLLSKPTWELLIAGHTDNVGSEESNLNLSKNRTQAVGKYLQGKGVPASQVQMEWYGESRPVADNSTPEGRQKNRRVEMQIDFD